MRRKRAPKITYRTLKAEIRALLDRPGVVPEAEERILDWLNRRNEPFTEETNRVFKPVEQGK